MEKKKKKKDEKLFQSDKWIHYQNVEYTGEIYKPTAEDKKQVEKWLKYIKENFENYEDKQ